MRRIVNALLVYLVACSPVKGTPLIDAFVLEGADMTITPTTVTGSWQLMQPTQLAAKATLNSSGPTDVTALATWTTSDPAIATVDHGLVTPIGSGAATITASYAGATGSAGVTLRNATLVVSTITFEGGSNEIDFYDLNASGSDLPLRSITGGSAFALGSPWGMAIRDNELYVAVFGGIAVYPLDQDGSAAPSRFISGSGMSGIEFTGLALGSDRVFASAIGSGTGVYAFPLDADGSDLTPLQTITGSAAALAFPCGISILDNEMFIGNDQNGGVITVYPLDANGSAAFDRQISTGQQFANFELIADGEVFTSSESGVITVYPPDASGSAVPLRRITGSAAAGAVGTIRIGDELYVTNYISAAMQVTSANATELAPVIRTLSLRGSPRGIVAY